MNKPTHGQWRGYALLCGLLFVLLVLLLVWPVAVQEPKPSDNSQLAEAVARYGDGIVDQNHFGHASYRHGKQWNYDTFRYDYSNEKVAKRHFSDYDTLVVDINTADTARLRQLRGIGTVFAARIVKYRALLGGFVDKNQLLEVYGMTEDRFASIEPHIDLSLSLVHKIPINSASLDELRRHPYLDYYQARAIVDYRNSVGQIKNADDLLKINLIDQLTARKIADYIQYN